MRAPEDCSVDTASQVADVVLGAAQLALDKNGETLPGLKGLGIAAGGASAIASAAQTAEGVEEGNSGKAAVGATGVALGVNVLIRGAAMTPHTRAVYLAAEGTLTLFNSSIQNVVNSGIDVLNRVHSAINRTRAMAAKGRP